MGAGDRAHEGFGPRDASMCHGEDFEPAVALPARGATRPGRVRIRRAHWDLTPVVPAVEVEGHRRVPGSRGGSLEQ